MKKSSHNNSSLVELKPWTEIIGEVVKIKEGKTVKVSIDIGGNTSNLEFPRDSREGKSLLEGLKDVDEHDKIGILRTDIVDTPVKIRFVKNSQEAKGDRDE